MTLTTDNVIAGLSIVVGVMLIIVLYHILFIVVDARRIMRRVEDLTAQVESVVMKPLAIADQMLGKIMAVFEHKLGKKHHRKD